MHATCCCCQRRSSPVRCVASPSRGIAVAARLSHPPHHARAARPGSPRQGPRHLRPRRSPADRRHRSHFGLRLRARLGHPGQGQGPDADLGVLVRPDAGDRAESRDLDRRRATFPPSCRGRCGDARRTVDARPQDRTAADRMRGARLPVRIGLEGLRRRRARSAAFALPAGLLESSRLPEPIFTPATKAQSGHDINISVDDAADARRSRRARARARADAPAVRRRRRARRIGAASSSPTRSSSSACCPRTDARAAIA